MKIRAPEFVRQRIEWRAKKEGLPFKNTGFWSEAPEALQRAVPATFLCPVVFSLSDSGEATVIGIDEVLVNSPFETRRMSLDDLIHVTSPSMEQRKRKLEADTLELEHRNGQRMLLPAERGPGCFAIWNILLMLAGMARKGGGNDEANESNRPNARLC